MNGLEKGCPFCNKIKREDKDILWIGTTAVFTPLFPVVDGHKLIVPIEHVEDFGSDKDVSARTMKVAADIARTHEHVNLITSKGHYATQSVKHLHLHIVPREQGDGLHLPWTGQCKYGCKDAGEHYHQEEVASPKDKE